MHVHMKDLNHIYIYILDENFNFEFILLVSTCVRKTNKHALFACLEYLQSIKKDKKI